MKFRKGTHDATGLRFGIVVSKFNKFVTSRLLAAAVETLKKAGAADEALEVVRVPGAFEIPLAARALARTGRFDAVLCLGAVIRGDTPHFDYISAEASRGIGQVALECDLPVIFGVLTTNTVAQAIERADPAKHNRGADAARTAIEMVTVLREVQAKPAIGRSRRPTTSQMSKKKTGTRA
jgi:6,7-dimethyl-8-ribityllumazine synthase